MNVRELIEKMQEFDPDLLVGIGDCCNPPEEYDWGPELEATKSWDCFDVPDGTKYVKLR